MTIRALLADDHEMVLDGLISLLGKESGIEVVGTAANGRAAVERARDLRPDLVLMDLSMPGLNGMEATRQILAARPEIKVICLSMHAERRFVSAALDAGASGYVLKERAMQEVIKGIRAVMAGGIYLDTTIAGEVLEGYRASLAGHSPQAGAALSGREVEVLQLMAEGHGTREIGELLHISMKTVSSHREHIMDKLGIRSIAGLTKYAIRQGLTTSNREHSGE